MAAAVTSTTASRLLRPKLFLSSTSDPPPLIIIRSPPIRISHGALRLPSPASSGSTRSTPIRCRPNRSGDSNSPLNCGSECYNRREGHWFVVMDKPGGEGASRQEMVACYVQTLARVVGGEEEAKKKIYVVLCEGDYGFGCVIDEETKEKIKGLPGVRFVFHDPYADTGINKLKHSALEIESTETYGHSGLLEQSKSIGGLEAKRQLEEAIESVSEIFWTQRELNSHHLTHWNILTQMDQVLYELSLNLKALWEEAGDYLKDSDIHRIEQAAKAIESLSLVKEAADTLCSTECDIQTKMEQNLYEISRNVGSLRLLPIKEPCTSSEKQHNNNSGGSSHVLNLQQFRRRINLYHRHVRDCAKAMSDYNPPHRDVTDD